MTAGWSERHVVRTRCGHGGRARLAALPVDRASGQAGGALRRPLSDYRFRPVEFDQLGHSVDLRRHPIQSPVALGTSRPRLAGNRFFGRTFYHAGAGADALGRRLVPGHRRLRVSESLLARAAQADAGGGVWRRPYLPDERPANDRRAYPQVGRSHGRGDSGEDRRSLGLRRHRGR